ncbi:hypothetical protein [Vibrio cholerae]
MKFNQLFVKVSATDNEDYGYKIQFGSGLNIIRGDNSSGKSTFVNSLIYALGMEEIIGSKGNVSLPYALKDRFVYGTEKRIVSSTVYLEIENRFGQVITLKRAIVSKEVDTKLIQIIEGPYLTNPPLKNLHSQYTFLHDAGSAQDQRKGFYAYLERFLGLELPTLSDNKGRETKLYLQPIFAALLIEQKGGWTDYIANIPYYGVSGMREKVASFLLDLDSFRNAKKLSELQSQRSELMARWSELVTELKVTAEGKYLSITGISKVPTSDFDSSLVSIGENVDGNLISINTLKQQLFDESEKLNRSRTNNFANEPEELVKEIRRVQNRIDELLLMQGMCGKQIKISESQFYQYVDSLKSIEKDLNDNKLTEKLVKFGANEADLDFVKGKCHTCLNPIDDILISPDSVAMPMSLEENITHLNNQKKMTQSLLDGLEKNIEKNKNQLLAINREVLKLRKELVSLKRDIKSTEDVKEADVRRRIYIENRQQEVIQVEGKVNKTLEVLSVLSMKFKKLNGEIASLSKYPVSKQDLNKIYSFTDSFKSLARKFGYRSAEVDEIEVKSETLLPYLKDIELRGRVEKNSSTDIKTDSSASDFVRLIWSYLISLYKTSSTHSGNHLGVLLFDEPAQHSMSTQSVNEMLKTLADTRGLQSIVAASFDENEEAYASSVKGLGPDSYTLVRLPRKIIAKL